MFRRFLAILTIVFVPFALTEAFAGQARNDVTAVQDNDREMNAAIARARQTLDHYWKAVNSKDPKITQPTIKVLITDKHGSEHIWLVQVRPHGKGYIGLISNKPVVVKKVSLGQPYQFTKAEVTDWMYRKNGKIYGAYTLRVLVKRMPKEQAAYYRRILAYQPK